MQKFFRDSAFLLDNFIMQSQFFISEFRNGIILGPGKLSTFRDSICDRFTKFHFGLSSAVSLSFTYVALSKQNYLQPRLNFLHSYEYQPYRRAQSLSHRPILILDVIFSFKYQLEKHTPSHAT